MTSTPDRMDDAGGGPGAGRDPGLPPLALACLCAAFVLGLVGMGAGLSGGHALEAGILGIGCLALIGTFVTVWAEDPRDAAGARSRRARILSNARIWVPIAAVVLPICALAGWIPLPYAVLALPILAVSGALRTIAGLAR